MPHDMNQPATSLSAKPASMASADTTPSSGTPSSLAPSIDSEEARAFFRNVDHIYTDLDGTLFAPGGVLLKNHAGEYYGGAAKAVADVQRAGIELIIDTGRSAMVSDEIMRMLGIETFIGEMGAEIQLGWGPDKELRFCLGDWDFNPEAAGKTPFQAIAESGVVEALFEAFGPKLAYHDPFCYEREIVHLLRGFIDLDKAQRIIDTFPIPLVLVDNGPIASRRVAMEGCPEIRSYHLVPRGASKEVALREHMRAHGYDPKRVLAIGDAPADVRMGEYAGAVVVPNNSQANPLVQEAVTDLLARGKQVFFTSKPSSEGWAEMATILLEERAK